MDDFFFEEKIKCWRCHEEISVYTWRGREIWCQDRPFRYDYPASIKMKYSGTIEASYWANTCSVCGSIQGDWYLDVTVGIFNRSNPRYLEWSLRGDK